MFYLIINEQIRKYIDMIKDVHFGCKKYCPLQIIALDEMELLRKKLKKIDIDLSNEELENMQDDFLLTTTQEISQNNDIGTMFDELNKYYGEDFDKKIPF